MGASNANTSRRRQRRPGRDSFAIACRERLAEFAATRPIRAGSLVVSLLGDAIAPRGGSVWLGSVIDLLAPFGINDRLVRTSVFRLAKQGWLSAERIGRRSFYQLTDRGLRRFVDASRRIYAEPRSDWQGEWCLALIAGAEGEVREQLRRELGWQGFAPLSSNVLAHPAPDPVAVDACLADIPGSEPVLMMHARAEDSRRDRLLSTVRDAWQLDELGRGYAQFLERFRPVYAAAREQNALNPALALSLRVLLIHEYRRLLLRDPSLPAELLPDPWDGTAAFQLCRNLYDLVALPAERYLSEQVENAYGPLPPAEPGFYQRFGGLRASSANGQEGTNDD